MPFDLTENEELYITGEVLAIYFSNPSNFYKVILVEIEETNSDYLENNIVITGNFDGSKKDLPMNFMVHLQIIQNTEFSLKQKDMQPVNLLPQNL